MTTLKDSSLVSWIYKFPLWNVSLWLKLGRAGCMLRGLGNLSRGELCSCPAGRGWLRIVRAVSLDVEPLQSSQARTWLGTQGRDRQRSWMGKTQYGRAKSKSQTTGLKWDKATGWGGSRHWGRHPGLDLLLVGEGHVGAGKWEILTLNLQVLFLFKKRYLLIHLYCDKSHNVKHVTLTTLHYMVEWP